MKTPFAKLFPMPAPLTPGYSSKEEINHAVKWFRTFSMIAIILVFGFALLPLVIVSGHWNTVGAYWAFCTIVCIVFAEGAVRYKASHFQGR